MLNFYMCQHLMLIASHLRKSVCLSVTLVDHIETVEPRITGFSPHDSPGTLVSENLKIVQKFETNLLNATGVRNFGKIHILSCYTSETVRRSVIVTINHE